MGSTNIKKVKNDKKEKNKDEVKKDNRKHSHIVSLLILVFIVPILILLGSDLDHKFIWIDVIAITLLNILLVLGIYEIVNFTIGSENSKDILRYFLVISFPFSFLFLFFSFIFIENFNKGFELLNPDSEMFLQEYLWIDNFLLITILFYFLITFIFFIIEFNSKNDMRDSIVIYLVSSMLLLFLFNVLISSKILNWPFVLMVILMVSASDTFAYIGGKKFGKTKIFPEVSPNKTLEGLLIGYLSAFIVFIFFFSTIIYWTNLSGWSDVISNSGDSIGFYNLFLIITVLITIIIAPFGDLFFSKIKRIYEKKDFSKLIPGHGGLFDRIDSHIFAMNIFSLIMYMLFLLN